MTQEIIDMAQECGLIGMRPHLDGIYSEALEAFAKLVADRALAEHAMQEVQRLGQEIEQEPVAWEQFYTTAPQRTEQEPVALPCCGYTDASAVKWNPLNGVVQCHNCGQTYTPPAPQRKPLTDEQRQELMSKAWNKWLSRKDDGRLFAWDFSFEVEAAHGIKETT
jgi:hypothetical protein